MDEFYPQGLIELLAAFSTCQPTSPKTASAATTVSCAFSYPARHFLAIEEVIRRGCRIEGLY